MHIHHEEFGAGHPVARSTVHRLASELANAEVHTIPDADHVSLVTDPRFRTKVLDFLARHDVAEHRSTG